MNRHVRFHYPCRCIIAAATLIALAAAQIAQSTYPAKPIRIVVPFAPGGVNDLIGQRYAQEMGRVSGATFIVDNRGGVAGTIGAAEVARAKPDGYTLLLGGTATHVISPVAMRNPAYDAAIIDQLHQAQAKVVLDPGFQAFLRKSGAVPVTSSSPERTAQFLRTEIARWAPIIKATGYKVE